MLNKKRPFYISVIFIFILAVVVIGVVGYLALTKTQEPQVEQQKVITSSDDITEGCTPTGQDVQGPFYLPNAPFRTNLAQPDESGDKLIVRGRVLDAGCESLADAVVDIWH